MTLTTVKLLNVGTLENFAVIYLKFKQSVQQLRIITASFGVTTPLYRLSCDQVQLQSL